MRAMIKRYALLLTVFVVGGSLVATSADAYMGGMGMHHWQPQPYPTGPGDGMTPGYHMPGTWYMDVMINEIYPQLLEVYPAAEMWQGPDGALRIRTGPQGPVYTYYVPMEGWMDIAGDQTAPHMYFDNGAFQATTSGGRYWGRPAPYDPDGFTNMIRWMLNGSSDITYRSDGTLAFALPTGNQWSCLVPSAQAVSASGAQPGIYPAEPGSIYSNVMFQYADGYRQDFHPAFAHPTEIVNSLANMPGIRETAIGADGVITCVLDDGTTVHHLAFHPALIYETGSSYAGHGLGFDPDQGWWFGYSGGGRQYFRLLLDGSLYP